MDAALQALDAWSDDEARRLARFAPTRTFGRIVGVSGILLESCVPRAKIGDLCNVQRDDGSMVLAEIVGFSQSITLLSALGALDGIAIGARVTPLFRPHSIVVGAS